MNFYSLQKVLSYNVPVNVIITERGYGKSFSVKDYVIKQYKKNGSQFAYIRRYDNELKSVFEHTSMKASENKKDFFDDLKPFYPEDVLEAKNRKFYINNECFGFAKRMTEAQDLKSSTFTNVKTIIIDEYPIEKGKRYYLPNEGMILMNIFDSIIRNRSDVKIFILGNAVEGLEYCPLFLFFGLQLPYGKKDIKLFKDNLILLQYANSEEFRKEREKTLIGRLAKGTAYEDYAMKNKILDKSNTFIEKKKGSAIFSFAFIYHNGYYGVWNDFKESKIFISKDYDKSSPYIYAVTTQDHRPNTLLIKSASKSKQWKFLLENYKLGLVYFESQTIKKYATDVIKMFLTS